LDPVVPVSIEFTVHVVAGEPPTAVTTPRLGAVPPVFSVASVKLPALTPVTGSANVTVHDNGPASTTADPPARTIELTVGAVVS